MGDFTVEESIEDSDAERPFYCQTHANMPSQDPAEVGPSRFRYLCTLQEYIESIDVRADRHQADFDRLLSSEVRVLPPLVVQEWDVVTNALAVLHVLPTDSGWVLEFRYNGPRQSSLTACTFSDRSELHTGKPIPQSFHTAELLTAAAVEYSFQTYLGLQYFPSCHCRGFGVGPVDMVHPTDNLRQSEPGGLYVGVIYNFQRLDDPPAWGLQSIEPGWWIYSS